MVNKVLYFHVFFVQGKHHPTQLVTKKKTLSQLLARFICILPGFPLGSLTNVFPEGTKICSYFLFRYFSDCSAATSNIPSDAMDSISVRTSHLGPDPPPSYDEALRRSSDALESLTQSMAEEEVKAAAAWVAGYGSSGSADEGIGLEEEALEKKKLLSSPVDDSETTRYHNSEEMRILVQPTPTKSGRRQRIESVV